MIVADPSRTKSHAEEIARILADRLQVDYFDVLTSCRKPDTRFQYIARRVPSTLATKVVDELEKRKFQGVATRNDPLRAYPAKDVAANLLGFLNDEGQPSGGLELQLQPAAGRQGRLGDLRDRRRQPDPARREHRGQAGRRQGPDPDHRPRRPVVRPAGVAQRRTTGQGAVRHGRRDGRQDRRDHRVRRLPVLRREPADEVTQRRPRLARPERRLRAGLGAEGDDRASLLDAGKITPETQITVPKDLPVLDRVIHDYFDHGPCG